MDINLIFVIQFSIELLKLIDITSDAIYGRGQGFALKFVEYFGSTGNNGIPRKSNIESYNDILNKFDIVHDIVQPNNTGIANFTCAVISITITAILNVRVTPDTNDAAPTTAYVLANNDLFAVVFVNRKFSISPISLPDAAPIANILAKQPHGQSKHRNRMLYM